MIYHFTDKKSQMKLLAVISLCAAFLLAGSTVQGQATKIFMVRHADRDGALDALRVPQGITRAAELKRILKHTGIDSIYSTNTTRTRETAKPLADFLNITTALYSNSNAVIDTIIKKHLNKEILVVGHSNTIDSLIKRCGCTGIGLIPDTQFDNFFLVIITRYKIGLIWKRKCELLKMKYGAVTN
jgi:broad specificity phosphatase PhoE